MGLTDIGSQLTPGTPTELTFAAPLNLPAVIRPIVLIGHQGATGGASAGSASGANYVPIQIANVGSVTAASGEASGYFGPNSELAKMVVAAVAANQNSGNFPPIIAVPLASTDTGFGSALTAIDPLACRFVVSPYDGQNNTLHTPFLAECQAMSAPQRVDNGQYGTQGVAASQQVISPATLYKYDTPYGAFTWFPNTTPTQLNGEVAASVAAQLAANPVPFNPVKNLVIPNLLAPAKMSDWVTVGGGLESEVALTQGWSPLRVLPNQSVAQLRARTLRVTIGDGVTGVTAYFDVMDFDVLFFWRQTLVTRFAQSDLSQTKASPATAQLILSEVIRLAQLFQTNGMFESIDTLAKEFVVQRNASDRSRFDVFTPVNVIPILAVIATNIQATTQGDTLTI